MKKFKFYIGCLLFVSMSLACYEPIANTSGGTDAETTKNENTATENMGNTEKTEATANSFNKENSENSSTTKNDTKPKDDTKATGFRGNLTSNLSKHNLTIADIYDSNSVVETRILSEYGAVFLTKAKPPTKVMFTTEAEVSAFQSKAGVSSANIGATNVELQPDALKALQSAIEEAKNQGKKITPRDGAEAGKRNYEKTLSLWNNRFFRACDHWKAKGRLKEDQISKLKALPIKQQVAEVLELEKQGIYFNTFFNNSILYSVAAPGTSQHLSMLAFDANEYADKKVREIMAQHGWFRTVQNDEPHFTYLGYQESDLPNLGLKKVTKKGTEFWIPDI